MASLDDVRAALALNAEIYPSTQAGLARAAVRVSGGALTPCRVRNLMRLDSRHVASEQELAWMMEAAGVKGGEG